MLFKRLDQLIHCEMVNAIYQIVYIMLSHLGKFPCKFSGYLHQCALYCVPRNSLLYLFTHGEACQYVEINHIEQEVDARETCVCVKYLKPLDSRTEKYLFSVTRERKREQPVLSRMRVRRWYFMTSSIAHPVRENKRWTIRKKKGKK